MRNSDNEDDMGLNRTKTSDITIPKLKAIEDEINSAKAKKKRDKKNKNRNDKVSDQENIKTPMSAKIIDSDKKNNTDKTNDKVVINKIDFDSNTEKEKKDTFGQKELNKISEEMNLVKVRKNTRQNPKLLKIFENLIFGIVFVLYIYAIMMMPKTIEKENFINILKILSLVLMLIVIGLLEIGYRIKKSELYMHAVEILFLSSYTTTMILLVEKTNSFTKTFHIIAVCIILVYYAIKSILIWKNKQFILMIGGNK